MTPQRITVTRGATDLATFVWGAEGIPIVALHPGIADSRIWQWCAPAWAEAGHRVVAYDRRGFGETSYRAEPHDVVDDLLAVTESVDARPAVIVGNSLGGGIALDLALNYPEQVLAVVLIGSSASGYDPGEWPTVPAEAEQDALIMAAEEAGDMDLASRLEVRYWLDGVDQPEGRVGGAARELLTEMNARVMRAPPTGDAAAREPVWQRLGEIASPALVMVGEHDLPGINQQGEALAAALPHGRLITVAGSAHCPSLDQPEFFARAVLDFIDESVGS